MELTGYHGHTEEILRFYRSIYIEPILHCRCGRKTVRRRRRQKATRQQQRRAKALTSQSHRVTSGNCRTAPPRTRKRRRRWRRTDSRRRASPKCPFGFLRRLRAPGPNGRSRAQHLARRLRPCSTPLLLLRQPPPLLCPLWPQPQSSVPSKRPMSGRSVPATLPPVSPLPKRK